MPEVNQELRDEIKRRLRDLEDKRASKEALDLIVKAFDQRMERVEARIASVEDVIKWATRSTIASSVSSLLQIILIGLMVVLGLKTLT